LQSVAFNTDNLNDLETLKVEFKVSLESLEDELNEAGIFRFRFFEFLFMERCAIL